MRLVKRGWALSLSLTALCCPGLLAQSGSIEGVVLDDQSKPIAGAEVYALSQEEMRHPDAITTTDSRGKFTLQGLSPGGFYIYAYKESDGYPNGFLRFLTTPNSQSPVVAKVEAGQETTGVTMRLGARFAHLKLNVTDEKGKVIPARLVFTREDQPGDYITGTDIKGQASMLVPPMPFRLKVIADGYEEWHYGGANWQGKAGLIALKSDQTFSLDARLRKKQESRP